jgi:hypothetical protein
MRAHRMRRARSATSLFSGTVVGPGAWRAMFRVGDSGAPLVGPGRLDAPSSKLPHGNATLP